MKAIWKNMIIAESNDTVIIENNHYFPASAIHQQYFINSDSHTVCPWKGSASYYSLLDDGEENKDAARYYPDPKPAVRDIKNRIAFWKGVKTVE